MSRGLSRRQMDALVGLHTHEMDGLTRECLGSMPSLKRRGLADSRREGRAGGGVRAVWFLTDRGKQVAASLAAARGAHPSAQPGARS